MQSTSRIQSQQAQRIAKRLLNHWRHKFEVAETEQHFEIFMPSATVKLDAQADALEVNIIFQDPKADTTQLEKVVLDHLSRMGNETLHALWQHHPSTAQDTV